MYTEKELLLKKKEIEAAKTKIAELKGEEKALTTQLKTEFGCDTIQQAKKKLKKLEINVAEIDKVIEEKSKTLQELYDIEEEEED